MGLRSSRTSRRLDDLPTMTSEGIPRWISCGVKRSLAGGAADQLVTPMLRLLTQRMRIFVHTMDSFSPLLQTFSSRSAGFLSTGNSPLDSLDTEDIDAIVSLVGVLWRVHKTSPKRPEQGLCWAVVPHSLSNTRPHSGSSHQERRTSSCTGDPRDNGPVGGCLDAQGRRHINRKHYQMKRR